MSETTITEEAAWFTAPHKALTDALKTVGLAVPRHAPSPALRGVLVDVYDGLALFKAFDHETAITVQMDGEPDECGLSLYEYDELKAMLAGAVAGEKPAVAARVPVTLHGGVLSTPELAVPLETMDAGEYPAFPPAAPVQMTVDGEAFFRALGRVLPARGTDITMPTCQAVRLRTDGGTLHLTATDRYRIAVAQVEAEAQHADVMDALVRGDILARLAARMGGYAGPVRIGTHSPGGAPYTTLDMGLVTATVRCVEGAFPAVEDLLPGEAAAAVTVDRAGLVRAVRKAHALAGTRKGCAVRLDTAADGAVHVAPEWWDEAAQGRTRGVAVDGCMVHGSAPDWPLRVNGSFLLDGLSAFAGETVTLHMRTAAKPLLITDGPDVAGDGFRYLQMPVRRG